MENHYRWQILGNSASFYHLKKFAEQKWRNKGLLETQKLDEEFFLFRFQSEAYKQEILDLSPLPFGNSLIPLALEL